MSDVVLITPPDRLYTQEKSILLIHPSFNLKEEFQNILLNVNQPTHVYLYDLEKNHENYWLIDVFNHVDIVIFDIDNSSPEVRSIAGYFLAKDKTFWLTNSGESMYNTISKNQIFTLDFLKHKLGGGLENETQQ
tara:strand:- start:199 stop:600 length:402 start_codon:yes stop_codon:yes gene_type:complete